MNKKFFLIFVVLALLGTGGLFAQNNGYVKPTFSLGFTAASEEKESLTLVTMGFDIDFVSYLGLTLGTQFTMSWKTGEIGPDEASFYAFGGGYTYDAGVWSAGGKLMAIPWGDGGIGFDINGTYYFTEAIGVTGIMDIYFGVGTISWMAFSLRIGLSVKI